MAVSREIAQQRLVSLAWEGSFEVAALMIWHKERWLSPPLKPIVDLAKDEMKENFSSEYAE